MLAVCGEEPRLRFRHLVYHLGGDEAGGVSYRPRLAVALIISAYEDMTYEEVSHLHPQAAEWAREQEARERFKLHRARVLAEIDRDIPDQRRAQVSVSVSVPVPVSVPVRQCRCLPRVSTRFPSRRGLLTPRRRPRLPPSSLSVGRLSSVSRIAGHGPPL